tara:strand:+ start:856 stop:2223 length:1368 start_codon:yes stop_codon:yes gene_type:complete
MNLLFFGLGRIGLPQSLVFSNNGICVYGYDVNEKVIDNLNKINVPFHEEYLEETLKKNINKTFFPIKNWEKFLYKIDILMFTLGTGTPDSKSCIDEPEGDISKIYDLVDNIFEKQNLKKNVLLVFRTTLFLGSCDLIKAHIENKYSLIEGIDFHLSFVPERLVEGSAINEEKKLPKIIGSYNDEGYKRTQELFSKIGGKILRVSNPKTAEFCKLTDNTYRNTIFGYSNDLAMWATHQKIDVHEVIDTVNKDYERNNIPKPGFVSGYCLGKDPYILEYGFSAYKEERDFQSLWYYGRRVNDLLVNYAVKAFTKQFTSKNIEITNSSIALLGLSYKNDIDDFRMSHAFSIIDNLLIKGYKKIYAYDPNYRSNQYTKLPEKYNNEKKIVCTNKLENLNLDDLNGIIVSHMHKEIIDYEKNVLKHIKGKKDFIIFDGWNIWKNVRKEFTKNYSSIGFQI